MKQRELASELEARKIKGKKKKRQLPPISASTPGANLASVDD